MFTRVSHKIRLQQNFLSTFGTKSKKQNYSKIASFTACLVGSGITVAYVARDQFKLEAAVSVPIDQDVNAVEQFGKFIKGLPIYTSEDVAKHTTPNSRLWISYRSGVYDITDFIKEHPGGNQIMIGVGTSVEPFWNLYAVHKNVHVLQLLEKYRIGNLAEEIVKEKSDNDPFWNEPVRHTLLKPSSKTPFNAEPPLGLLTENFITPKELFYVRNHLPVPTVDMETYSLDVEGIGMKDASLSLADIKMFPKHTISAAVQCGGNRRSEMTKVKSVRGLNWGQAAISNAEWSGAKLRDVLLAAGIKENDEVIRHVQFEGMDTDPTNNPYGASIPIEKAMDPNGDVLLAYEMNGNTLSRDHGFPLRVIVPGTVGARSVKWLGRIVVSDSESPSHWQQNDYKGFAPNIDWDTVDFSKSPAIQDMPVTSAICYPTADCKVKPIDGKINLKGYAYSGGGRKIIRVDVSTDGGKSWREVDGYVNDSSRHPKAWAWTLWTAQVPVQDGIKDVEIVVKAVDSSYNTQPADFASIWNLRGVLSNAYHRVKVFVDQ